MRSVAIVRDYISLAREAATALLLAVLLLVTGCAETRTAMRAELAPPPPQRMPDFSIAQEETFGPAVPQEIALLRLADMIEPSGGECGMTAMIEEETIPLGLHVGGDAGNSPELSFQKVQEERDSVSVMATFTLALPSPAASDDCR